MRRHKIDMLDIMKYGMLLVILVYVVLLLVREGGDAPMKEVKKQVLSAVKTEGMTEAGAQDLKRYYGLNAEDYDEVFLYLPDDVMSVDEILLVRLKEAGQAEAVRAAAQKRLNTQIESFEGYGAAQTKLLKAAVLEDRGSYVCMFIGKNADEAYSAFKKSL